MGKRLALGGLMLMCALGFPLFFAVALVTVSAVMDGNITEAAPGLFGSILYFGLVGAYFKLNSDLKEHRQDAIEDANKMQLRLQALGNSAVSEHLEQVSGLPKRALMDDASSVADPSLSGAEVELVQAHSASAPAPLREASEARARCPWCAFEVPPALAAPQTGRATCPSCTTQFSLREEMQKRMGARPQPLGLDVERQGDGIVFKLPTNKDYGTGILSALLVVATFLLIPDAMSNKAPTLVLGCAAAAAVCGFLALAFARQRIVLQADGGSLSATISGFWPSNIGHWVEGGIDQVFVRRRERTRGQTDISGRRKRVKAISYDLILREPSGREFTLAREMYSAVWALYIEQEIEQRLNVVERDMKQGPAR